MVPHVVLWLRDPFAASRAELRLGARITGAAERGGTWTVVSVPAHRLEEAIALGGTFGDEGGSCDTTRVALAASRVDAHALLGRSSAPAMPVPSGYAARLEQIRGLFDWAQSAPVRALSEELARAGAPELRLLGDDRDALVLFPDALMRRSSGRRSRVTPEDVLRRFGKADLNALIQDVCTGAMNERLRMETTAVLWERFGDDPPVPTAEASVAPGRTAEEREGDQRELEVKLRPPEGWKPFPCRFRTKEWPLGIDGEPAS